MRLIPLGQKTNIPLSIALGYFDCLHAGHRALINAARMYARDGAQTAMFTFDTEPSAVLTKTDSSIYTFKTRVRLAEEIGVQAIVYADFNERLRDLVPEEFLAQLFSSGKISTVVCGRDFTYGSKGRGDVTTLSAACKKSDVRLVVVDDILADGVKVSSTHIRKLLLDGKIEDANRLFCKPYCIEGIVEHGRGEGRGYKTPTANFIPNKNLLCPLFGVYGTMVKIDGKDYRAITNLGAKPTFEDTDASVETYIIGYNGNLYGRELVVEFHKRLREIRKFDSTDALYAQIEKDKEWSL